MNTVDKTENLESESYTRSLKILKHDRINSIVGIAGSIGLGYISIFEITGTVNPIPNVRALMIGMTALVGLVNAHELGSANHAIETFQNPENNLLETEV